MGNNKLDISILSKRVELLELRLKDLLTMEPDALNERLGKIEQKLFVVKEMMTIPEVSEYLGISQSQIYKMTMKMEIPHYKPKGKTIYIDRKELVRWMRNNHITPVNSKLAEK